MKFDAAACGFPTDPTDDIRGRHWPLLGKNVLRKPLRLNASKESTLTPKSPFLIGPRPRSRRSTGLMRTYDDDSVDWCATRGIIFSNHPVLNIKPRSAGK